MKLINLSLIVTFATLLCSCSSTRERYAFKKQKIDDQVWQCKELCSAGTIDIVRIEGLKCMCNRPQQTPVINNIIAPTAPAAVQSHQPASVIVVPQYSPAASSSVQRAPAVDSKAGYVYESSNGNRIISTTK